MGQKICKWTENEVNNATRCGVGSFSAAVEEEANLVYLIRNQPLAFGAAIDLSIVICQAVAKVAFGGVVEAAPTLALFF